MSELAPNQNKPMVISQKNINIIIELSNIVKFLNNKFNLISEYTNITKISHSKINMVDEI